MFSVNFLCNLGTRCKITLQHAQRCLGVIIIAALMACSHQYVELINSANQETTNRILLLLGSNDVTANTEQQKDGSYRILVAAEQKLTALSLLSANGLPDQQYSNLGEVFKKDSFISSPIEEHGRLLFALDQEISSLLSGLNGVIAVKTIINLPAPNDNLWQNTTPLASASVLIKYRQGQRLDLYINRIKSLVANSVPGLTSERVEVVTLMQRDN